MSDETSTAGAAGAPQGDATKRADTSADTSADRAKDAATAGAAGAPQDGAPKNPDEIKADIEQTRAQLAETADALAAKLDVKSQAGKKVHEVGEKASAKYDSAKQSAPAPVQQALGKVEHAGAPVVAKAAEDKKRTALIVGGAVAVVFVALRIKKRRSSS
ncbi:Protein of unknown function [Jatrophihabitans endophyticus]|uniref:DUF3618 domain-containing protein n=1 Tax=Jatrophihabitans endophyticus TaxID=1206085 RepID=A0A1M5E6N6_9ACTN|nr:DUF3618 domain-containing protein [Jatrophihabitans endophyticus]SHF74923.1 Protein of unknown function [Jatrophihabitans endophyticus]